MAGVLDLASYVQQQGDLGRQRGQQNQLAQLASQSYGAAPDQQQNILSRMALASPQAAQAQQAQFQQDEDRTGQQLRGYVNYVNQVRKSGTPAALNAAVAAGSGLIQRITGKPGPLAWTDDMGPGWAELEARVAMTPAGAGAGAAGVQSTYVDGEGNRVAIMRDGSTSILGKNDAGATQQTITINGPDGRPAQYTFDRRTGNYVPAGAAMGAPQQPAQTQGPATTQFTGPDGMPVQIGNDIPEHVRQQILANPQAFQDVPDGTMAQMPDRPVQQFSGGGQVAQAPQQGSPFVGRRPEDEAAAVEAAKLRTQIGFMPVQQQIETQGDVDRTIATERAKNQVEKEAGRGKARLSLEQATARVNRVDSLIANILPRVGYATAGLASLSSAVPGSPAGDLKRDIGTLQAIAGFDELNAMRASSPTGGALGNVTERELAFLQSVVRNIENSQSPQQLSRNLREFQSEVKASWQRVNQAYQQDYGNAQQPAERRGPPTPGAVQDGYRFRGGNPADPNSWERV